jgi:Zn finger protein HypA/HybF involved in hydrogenase expression
MKRWWCMECQEKVKLNRQGRCESCDSEGVDLLFKESELSHSNSATSSD